MTAPRTTSPMLARDAVRLAGAFAAATLIAAAVIALVAHLVGARLKSGLPYPRPTGQPADALGVLAANARLAALPMGAALLAPVLTPLARRALAGVVIGVLTANAIEIAVFIAADGTRALAALAPHAPLEVLALSVPAALYRQTHRGRGLPLREAMLAAVASVAVLAAAAALEVTPT